MAERMKVPFGTISITDRARELVLEALDTKKASCGKFVRAFEEKFAELVGVKEAVAVSSGTDANTLALAVLYDFGAQRGDEVIVPSISFVATGNSVVHAGFKPVFVDVERKTLNINPSLIEQAITEKTRAIMPVHLMGKAADMDAILDIARRHNLYVVEDAAEAHGTVYKGKSTGSIGHMGAFSLYVAHAVSTIEGGAVTTDREDFAEILISLRSHGRGCTCKQCVLNTSQTYCKKRFDKGGGEDIRFNFERIGYSSKMNELEAAVGIGNLEIYHETVNKRHANFMHVVERFDRFRPCLETITQDPWEFIGPQAIPITVQEQASFTRAEFTNYLETHGVETRTLFLSMPTQCPGFAYLGYKTGEFPAAEYIGKNGIHIGVHQDLGPAEMDYVLETITKFLETHQK